MCEWYEETKERRRSDEISEKKCVVFFLRFFCQKWNAATMFFVILDRTGRSFVKWLLRQCFLDSFVFFVVKRWDIMLLFHWNARCYMHLIGKLENEVTKGWKFMAAKVIVKWKSRGRYIKLLFCSHDIMPSKKSFTLRILSLLLAEVYGFMES